MEKILFEKIESYIKERSKRRSDFLITDDIIFTKTGISEAFKDGLKQIIPIKVTIYVSYEDKFGKPSRLYQDGYRLGLLFKDEKEVC